MAGTIQHHIAKSQTNGFIEKVINMNQGGEYQKRFRQSVSA